MRLLIAGGGTGGHLFPGVAIAEELRARLPDAEVLFVGTRRGIEARVLPGLGWPVEYIDMSGVKTVGVLGALRGLYRVPRAIWQSRRIIKRFKPDAVVGVGGYASFPAVVAAWLRRVPTAILEQNSIPGLSNKVLGKLVRKVFLAFEHTRTYFRARKIEMTGNPIRRAIAQALAGAAGGERAPGPFRLFVFGGSQGASAVNALVVDAMIELKRRGLAVDLVHQTGEADLEKTTAGYRDAGIAADVRAFIQAMAEEYRKADLVVARSGATTVAELTAIGRPAILIPYPFAADNHQEINAAELVAAGGARMYRQAELTGGALADAIAELAADPAARERMGNVMRGLGRPQAAATITDWCLQQTR
ncbi:MAG TPA: undecaprenyldiphospho-muramoylpentapeptide beta-N-acetylglucosaminyltransferase [Kofleriaceae bacterium]|nr:undecaprenyldiphospho-muramoylpentapeptide beta-N-acetylglucosaminyltransferase [Kofleriaceae bacterium]